MRQDNAMRVVSLFMLKAMFVYPAILISHAIQSIKDREYEVDDDEYDDEDNDEQIQEEINKYENLPEMPEMCQLFTVDDNTSIGVQFVSFCPDETAHIRVIGDCSFSQIYKRKVYRDDDGDRYFKLNNQRYYLKADKTKPISPAQAKSSK